MIIIGGEVRIELSKKEHLLPIVLAMMAASQAEEGCIAYAFSADLQEPDLLHLYEVWETGEALAAHGASAHMATFRRDFFPHIVKTDIKRYEARTAG